MKGVLVTKLIPRQVFFTNFWGEPNCMLSKPGKVTLEKLCLDHPNFKRSKPFNTYCMPIWPFGRLLEVKNTVEIIPQAKAKFNKKQQISNILSCNSCNPSKIGFFSINSGLLKFRVHSKSQLHLLKVFSPRN